MTRRLALAAVVSAAVILSAPFMGQLQRTLRAALPTGQYVLVVGGVTAAALGVIVVLALMRIRDRRALRFGLIGLALVVAAAYSAAVATPWPEVNAVERVHFVEYGLIAFLYYRVWRSTGDLSSLALPLLCAFMVGTLDEWLQWFIPNRVGEAHDTFLNLVAIVCGLMFGVAIVPPPALTFRLTPDGARRLGIGAAIVCFVYAGFVSQVHLGYTIDAEGIGRFDSHYERAHLEQLQRDRAARWQTNPPLVLRRLSREDQYLDEGLWHLRQRNTLWNSNDIAGAWQENLILERFFAPVLDTQTYASPAGNRWPPEQRADADTRRTPLPGAFVSAAEPYPIVVWNKAAFWFAVVSIALLLYFGARRIAAKSSY
jgi:VanZ family protein